MYTVQPRRSTGHALAASGPAGAARNVASVRETLGLSGKRAVIKTLMTITLHFPGRGAATRSARPRCKVAWRHPD
jgi:hypothetical protein